MKKIETKEVKKISVKKISKDTAFDEIRDKLIKKKGIDKEDAEEQAGKILSASKQKEKSILNENELQVQRSNGTYRNLGSGELDRIINTILKRESWYAERVNRKPMTTKNEVLNYIKAHKSFQYGSDWYDQIRIKPEPPKYKKTEIKMIKCACGHTIPESQVMIASLGRSCPKCYDRMSD